MAVTPGSVSSLRSEVKLGSPPVLTNSRQMSRCGGALFVMRWTIRALVSEHGGGALDRADGANGYRLAKVLLRRPLHAAYEISVEDRCDLPPGPVILAANHRSFMDSVLLALVVDRPISFLAKAEYFEKRRTAWMFRATGQIPIRRGSPSGAREALEAAKEVLSTGGVVGVYPEGTRSRDGHLHRGRLGPARLAWASGAAVVPVGLVGTEEVQRPGQRLPRLGKKVAVRFGSARRIDTDEVNRGRAQREFTERMMVDIARLSGQDYVGRFAMAGV